MNEFQTSTIKESVTKLADQGHETLDTIKSRVADVKTQVQEGGSAFRDRVTSYVNENPVKAVGIAFGLGYLAMRIRTSMVMELAFLGAFGYGVSRVIGRK